MKANKKNTWNRFFKTVLAATATVGTLFAANLAEAAVSKNGRVLIVVSELDSNGSPELAPLYGALETLTQVTTNALLSSEYKQIYFLKNRLATATAYANTIRLLSEDPSVQAIDTIMSVHGSTGRLSFADGRRSMADIERAVFPAGMNASTEATIRRKLRMMYNLSCFGRSHNATFRAMGYDIVAGSEGVNANSAVEFGPVLTNWKLGGKFVDGFAVSNSDAALWVNDGPIRAAGEWQRNSLAQTNSKKVFAGFSATRINSDAR